MIADNDRSPFTPAELRDLRVLRYRALQDGGDNAPMERVSYRGDYRDGARVTLRRVISWIEAINMEVPD